MTNGQESVLEACIKYVGEWANHKMITLKRMAAECEEDDTVNTFKGWSKGRLLSYLLDYYPDWQDTKESQDVDAS